MKRDMLHAILRVRQSTLDEAQKVIAEAYRAEQIAERQAHLAAEALEKEMTAATSLTVGDDVVETFARWLPIGRQNLKMAHDAQRDATAELDRARTVLALARSSVRAVESLMEQREKANKKEVGRREQQILDDTRRSDPS